MQRVLLHALNMSFGNCKKRLLCQPLASTITSLCVVLIGLRDRNVTHQRRDKSLQGQMISLVVCKIQDLQLFPVTLRLLRVCMFVR